MKWESIISGDMVWINCYLDIDEVFFQNPHENFSIMQKGRKVQMLEVKETIVKHEALNWFIFNIYVYHFLKGVTLFC